MRVLLLNDSASPIGGAELMTKTLRDGLRRRGHDVRVFASDYQIDHDGNFADFTCRSSTGPKQALRRTLNPSAASRLRAALREFQPDLVHVRMFLTQLSPLILPELRDRPAVFHVTDYGSVCPKGTKQLPDGSPCGFPVGWACRSQGCVSSVAWAPLMLQHHLFRRWRGAFDRIIANSHEVAAMLRRHGIEPVEVVWNGVPETPQRLPLDPAAPPLAVVAGRLTREKGVDVAIAAMAQVVRELPDAKLTIAGEGPERAALEQQVEALDLRDNVTLLGKISRDAVSELMGRAWVQLVPSRWREPFGLVAAEAMMRGNPVIATTGGGLAETIESGVHGWHVPPGDAAELARAMLRIMSDREAAERMGAAARARAVAEFSERVFLDRIEAHYRAIAGGYGSPAPSTEAPQTQTPDAAGSPATPSVDGRNVA